MRKRETWVERDVDCRYQEESSTSSADRGCKWGRRETARRGERRQDGGLDRRDASQADRHRASAGSLARPTAVPARRCGRVSGGVVWCWLSAQWRPVLPPSLCRNRIGSSLCVEVFKECVLCDGRQARQATTLLADVSGRGLPGPECPGEEPGIDASPDSIGAHCSHTDAHWLPD